ncbi:MarP family serine protease [Microbacterium sp. BWT-B31]|uniref:MarP family serine protease n=1 Tax=Microbacterium sp. BWT-B31 TaxID=3232072 RepID=UPI00352955BF
MILVDVLIVAVLVVALIVGIRRGFLGSIGSILGLVVGAAAAFWLTPLVSAWVPSLAWRSVVVVATAIGLVAAGAAIGAVVGSAMRNGVDKTSLRGVDRALGGVAVVVTTALALVVIAPSLAVTGMPGISAAVASSRVLGVIDQLTPEPMDAALAQLRAVVFEDGLPRFGELLDAGLAPTSPPVALDDPELQRAAASVARISGTAFACGTGLSGSGFVIAPDRVVTNAHVVAGVETPVVELPGRAALDGRVVHFDAARDLAVIAVDGLEAVPLPLTSTLAAGASAVVQGYPFGGPFTMVPAAVLAVGAAPLPDIYGEGAHSREIYALEADVQPGNSGGPVLTGDGAVAGVVFGRGENEAERGYAMTMAELGPIAAQASAWSAPVDSGRCSD